MLQPRASILLDYVCGNKQRFYFLITFRCQGVQWRGSCSVRVMNLVKASVYSWPFSWNNIRLIVLLIFSEIIASVRNQITCGMSQFFIACQQRMRLVCQLLTCALTVSWWLLSQSAGAHSAGGCCHSQLVHTVSWWVLSQPAGGHCQLVAVVKVVAATVCRRAHQLMGGVTVSWWVLQSAGGCCQL